MHKPKSEDERLADLMAANHTAFLMLACALAGMRVTAIAHRFGVSRQYIYRVHRPAMRAHGFDFVQARGSEVRRPVAASTSVAIH